MNKYWHFSCFEESNFSDDADEEGYEGYREHFVPEGYTAYCENGNGEPVYMYDQYEYDRAESPTAHRQKQSFCKKMRSCCSDMGRLASMLNIPGILKLLLENFIFWGRIFSVRKPTKDLQWQKV